RRHSPSKRCENRGQVAGGSCGIQARNVGNAGRQARKGRGLDGIALARLDCSRFAVAKAQLNLVQLARVRGVEVEARRGCAWGQRGLRDPAAKKSDSI